MCAAAAVAATAAAAAAAAAVVSICNAERLINVRAARARLAHRRH